MSDQINHYADTQDEEEVLNMARGLINGGSGKQAVRPLVVLLGSKSAKTRAYAAKYLGSIGSDAAEALPVLEIISKHDKIKVQRMASIAIRKIMVDQAITHGK